jgi:hypothetical protein
MIYAKQMQFTYYTLMKEAVSLLELKEGKCEDS